MSAEKPPVNHNVDYEEIIKFEVVASRWWDLGGEFRLLRHTNPLHLGYTTERAGGSFGKRVLDVGYSDGILVESMVCEGATVTDLDMGFEPLQTVKLHVLESGIQMDYVQETMEEYTVKHAGQYDVVTCMKILKHASDPQSVVRVCAQLVKPGDDVFLSTLNCNGKPWLVAVIGAEYILRMAPKGMYDVKKFIKSAELPGWVDQTSLRGRHITGPHYNLTTNAFKLGPGVDMNYMLHTQDK